MANTARLTSVIRIAFAFVCGLVTASLLGYTLKAEQSVQLEARELSGTLVVPTGFGGVYHYAIPGEFNKTTPSVGTDPTGGVLHVYLKAMRWADGHLRMKGFVFFEFNTPPTHWEGHARLVPVANVPEVKQHLRMGLRSRSGWEREISLETSDDYCEQQPIEDFDKCYERRKDLHSSAYRFPDISIDFGASNWTDIDLFVYGWPRHVSLTPQLHKPLVQHPPHPDSAPTIYHLVHCPFGLSADEIAKLLVWHIPFHLRIGFQGTVMYVRGADMPALEAHPMVRSFVQSGNLIMVAWDHLAHLSAWKYPFDQQVVLSHGVLSFWGEHVRIWAADFDEFFISGQPGSSVADMLATGCLSAQWPQCHYLVRRGVFTHREGEPAPIQEPELWKTSTSHPLLAYQYSSYHFGGVQFPKPLVDPSYVQSMTVHFTSLCMGTSSIADGSLPGKLRSACASRAPCAYVSEQCAWVAHVANMHVARTEPHNTSHVDPQWLWMLKGARSAPAV